jgi:hypothetical protein
MEFQDQLAFERFRYWRGQTLRSQDFRDEATTEARLRAWHNRAVHEAYGVSLGLTVTGVLDAKNNLAAVDVEPGIAHDCFGRLLLLQQPRKFAVPSLPDKTVTLVLVMRYRETGCYPKTETLPARSCGGESVLMESPEFCWEPAATFEVEDGVPLFQAAYKKGIAQTDVSFLLSNARPMARPHVATGCTLPGNTPWKPWMEPVFEGSVLLGAQTFIDTSAAGFTETPHYIAWLQDWQTQVLRGQEFSWVLTHVQDEVNTGFLFRVLWVPPDSSVAPSVASMMGKSYVCWMGCQEISGTTIGLCTGPAPGCGCGSGTEPFGKQE